MPDITKCTGEQCKFKEHCHRFVVPSNGYRQSYFANPPFFVMEDGKSHDCEYFWGTDKMTREYARWWLNNKEEIQAKDELMRDLNFKHSVARNPDDYISSNEDI